MPRTILEDKTLSKKIAIPHTFEDIRHVALFEVANHDKRDDERSIRGTMRNVPGTEILVETRLGLKSSTWRRAR